MHAHTKHTFPFHTPFHFTLSYTSRFTCVLDATVHGSAACVQLGGDAMGASLPKPPFVFALMSAARRASPSAHSHTHDLSTAHMLDRGTFEHLSGRSAIPHHLRAADSCVPFYRRQ